jgi:hypothetical protein
MDLELEELIELRQSALHLCDGDEFAAEILVLEWSRKAAQELPTVAGNPASALSNMLGSTATVHSGTTPANAPTVAYWVADSDAESRAVGVEFSMVPVNPTFGAFDVKPFGIVQFGTRGTLAQVEVDIGTGCRFAVEASQVILQVGVDPSVSPALDCDLILSGSLSFSPVARPTPITRTIYFENIGKSANTAGIPIKPFAKSVSFERAPDSSGCSLLFQNSALQTLYSVSLGSGARLTDPIPLANDVTQLVIVNGSDAVLQHARLIFNLGL